MANTSYSDELARRFTGYANQAAAKARFFSAEAECWRSMGYHHTADRDSRTAARYTQAAARYALDAAKYASLG